VEPENESVFGYFLITSDQQKSGFRRAFVRLSQRPTDLCATALFSFQGTNASAGPFIGRIVDRTAGARRPSHEK